MMQISSTFKATLLSPRTADYVAALTREGDKFDYSKWLQRVREEVAQAKRVPAAFTSVAPIAAEIGNSVSKSDCRGARPISGPSFMTKTVPPTRAICRPHNEGRGQSSKARLRQRLEKVREAWHDFQASRARDAVYKYLAAVFAVVEHYRVRRRTQRLLWHAFKFANLPFDSNADPFTAIIRCTCDDNVDGKTISKWARALRYVAHCKAPGTRLRTFMKAAGGVNACADLYAKVFGRGTR